MIRLTRPEPTDDQLTALAASGSSGFAKKAQAQRTQRKHAQLAAELRKAVSQ